MNKATFMFPILHLEIHADSIFTYNIHVIVYMYWSWTFTGTIGDASSTLIPIIMAYATVHNPKVNSFTYSYTTEDTHSLVTSHQVYYCI